MSDLQDLIARNGVMAFNSGYQEGQRDERDRIIALLPEIFATYFAKEEIVEKATKKIMQGRQK